MSRELLPFKVEVKSTYPFHEVIAAFNYEGAANFYARECSATNPKFEYRVTFKRKVRTEFKGGQNV